MTEFLTPQNYSARGAIDENQRGFVLLEPVDSGGPFERMAILMPAPCPITLAEEHAAHFNQGGSFRANCWQVLKGIDIPRLHVAPD